MVGALLILAAFVGGQTGRFDPHNLTYLWLNLVGAAILAVVAYLGENWGFTLLEAVWTVVSAASLWKVYRGERGSQDSQSSAPIGTSDPT
jgi:hypothetical protein